MATICAECNYSLFQGPNWYSQFCRAHEREPAQDVVTGEWGYASTNDLGRIFVDNKQYSYCRDINNGNCPDWTPKQTRWLDWVSRIKKGVGDEG